MATKPATKTPTKPEVKAAVHKHERNMHPGKPATTLAKGGMAKKPACGCKG